MSDVTATPSSHPQPSRRRFARRAVIAILIAGIASAIGIKAFAHGPGGWHRGSFLSARFDPAALDQRLERMLRHLYAEIDATDAQKQQLAPIVKAAAADLLPLRTRMHARGDRRSSCRRGTASIGRPSRPCGSISFDWPSRRRSVSWGRWPTWPTCSLPSSANSWPSASAAGTEGTRCRARAFAGASDRPASWRRGPLPRARARRELLPGDPGRARWTPGGAPARPSWTTMGCRGDNFFT